MPKPSRKKATPKAGVISSREVYHGPAFRVTADEVLEPSGVRTRRDIVHHSGSVVILAIEEEGGPEPRVLLERQYRHALAKVHGDPFLLRAVTELDRVLRDRWPTGVNMFRIDYMHGLLLTRLAPREQEAHKNERSLRMSLDRG